jgi:hypothetical protein
MTLPSCSVMHSRQKKFLHTGHRAAASREAWLMHLVWYSSDTFIQLRLLGSAPVERLEGQPERLFFQ